MSNNEYHLTTKKIKINIFAQLSKKDSATLVAGEIEIFTPLTVPIHAI